MHYQDLVHVSDCILKSESGVTIKAYIRGHPDDDKLPDVYFLSVSSMITLMTGGQTTPRFKVIDVLKQGGIALYGCTESKKGRPQFHCKAIDECDFADWSTIFITHHSCAHMILTALTTLGEKTLITPTSADDKCLMAYLHGLERRIVRIHTKHTPPCAKYTNQSFDSMITLVTTGLMHQTRTATYNERRASQDTSWTLLSAMFESMLFEKSTRFAIANSKLIQMCIFYEKFSSIVQSVEAEKSLLQLLADETAAEQRSSLRRQKRRVNKQKKKKNAAVEDTSSSGGMTDAAHKSLYKAFATYFNQTDPLQPFIIEIEDELDVKSDDNNNTPLSPDAPCFIPLTYVCEPVI